jgi:predicted dithiol-disulfide oxidoreductase (DUF899 family)
MRSPLVFGIVTSGIILASMPQCVVYSSYDTDFNFDYQVSFTQEELTKKEAFYKYIVQDAGIAEGVGISSFLKDPASPVFHTYSTYARGFDMLNVAYHYLDLVPKGRDEVGHAFPQFWVRRHDEYGDPRYINTEYYDVAKNL